MRSAQQIARGDAVPGRLQITQTTEAPLYERPAAHDIFVRQIRNLTGGVVDEDRPDDEDLISIGRRTCMYLTRDDIDSTREYIREYRSQRKELGFRVHKRFLVEGAALAEAAPPAFCPQHEGAVSARAAARIIGYDL